MKRPMKNKRPAKGIKKKGNKSMFNRNYQVNPAQIAKKAWAGVKLLKGLINTEFKFFDTVASAQALSTTAQIVSFNLIAQGTDYLNRIGNSIKVSSFQMRYSIVTDATQQTIICRHMLIVDNESDGANPATTDILETASVFSPLNHNNGKRFTVIKDSTFPLDSNSVNVASTSYLIKRSYEQYYEKLDYHIKFDNTTGVIASIKEGNLIGVWLTSSATSSPVDYYGRLRFIDN